MGAVSGWTWHQEIFRIAYEIARANNVSASNYLHRFFSNWN
jgi:hypothetical protein